MAESSSLTNRKIRKPLMERKRRARINKSLNELQQILTENQYTSKNAKLEKADILEMTVQYLRKVKENDYTQENKENADNLLLEKYIMGYKKCVEEVNEVVTQSQDFDNNTKNKINYFLSKCLDKVRNLTIKERNKQDIFKLKTYSRSFEGGKEIEILPQNANVIFLFSSALKEDNLKGNGMWRPW